MDGNLKAEILNHRATLEKIESKFNALLAAVADEVQEQVPATLDGDRASSEADRNQPL